MAGNPTTTATALDLAVDLAKNAVRRASALRVQLVPDLLIPAELTPGALTETAAAGSIVFTRSEPETWTVHRVERQVAAARADLEAAVVAVRAAGGTRAHRTVQGLLDVATGLLELGRQVNTGRARLIDHAVPHDGNAAQVAFWLYADASRRAEIVELNRLSNPNRITAGTVLQVYER